MTNLKKRVDEMEKIIDVISSLNEEIVEIEHCLAPIKTIKSLSDNPSVFDASTFANSQPPQLVDIILNLVEGIQKMKVSYKYVRATLESRVNIVLPGSESDSVQIQLDSVCSEISELKGKVDNMVTTVSTPLDFSKLDLSKSIEQAVNKVPQLQHPAPTSVNRQQVKEANDEQLRSNNLIIYNIAYDKDTPTMALDLARDYFNECGITSYYLEQKKIVDAQFLKVSEDKTTCSLRVIMSNQWVVRALLSDACKLKNSESTSYREHSFDFSKTCISKDMTRSEQIEHKRLILELKDNILKDGNTRWVIKFGKVQAWGKFQRS